MIISSASDYREAARRRVPPFMFHYADGGSYAEQTLARNVSDLENIALRQRVLKDMSELDTSIELFGEKLSMPTILAPVGACGMYARRGEYKQHKRRTIKVCRLPFQQYQFVQLKKSPLRLSVQCGFSFMC